MLWMKVIHIFFMVAWFAGLFYLPRLFVYHALSTNPHEQETFKVMERRLLIMMHIGAVGTWVAGLALLLIWLPAYLGQTWMQLKLALIVVLTGYHAWCVHLVQVFRADGNRKSDRWYRVFNEVPVLFLAGAVILVVIRPFG